jgi:hypothetical protein
MEKRGILLIFVLLMFALFCSPSFADVVDNVKPPITAVFGEKVVLIPPFLVKNLDTSQIFNLDVVFQQGNKTFTFVPSAALSNGRYEFNLYASDLVGNQKLYTYTFEVSVPGTRIFLVEPNSIGVANSTTFRVAVYSSRPSVCKYTGVSVSGFDDIRLKYFDVTGNLSSSSYVSDHFINSYSVEPDFPRHFYVVCRDDLGRDNLEHFMLYADVTPPTLSSVLFSPSPVVEYPPVGELSSMLKVTATEPVICKYSQNPNLTYADMLSFDGYDMNNFDAYKERDDQTILFPGDVIKQTFTFYVQCEDRARFLSAKVTRPITIDLGEGLLMRFLSPAPASRNTSVLLNLTTNRRAYCVFKSNAPGDPTSFTDAAAKLSSSYENLSTVHFKRLGTKPGGNYVVTVRCDVPEGVGATAMTAESSYQYVIDITPPSVPIVNSTTPVCTNVLSATFVANDTQSSIAEYRWSVAASGKVMANGSVTQNSVSVSKSNNGTDFVLSDQLNYVFSVIAVDAAGNIGAAGASNQIKFDSTGFTCDKIPPQVTVRRSPTGDSATIECFDNQSGCSSIGSYYGTSYTKFCNATQYFLTPTIIPFFRTTILCWAIKDNAGNVNSGTDTLYFNLSSLNISGLPCPNGIDNDGDGYGERCLLGADCNDADPKVSVGCVNGCIQDLDGDGYGLGCAAGNDCNGLNPALTTNCSNSCISDNDGDEFGLGCDNGPDCKGDDSTLTNNCPNGCIDDNDGDGYGLNCPVGLDCDGEDNTKMRDCDNMCIQDTDSDNYGIGCLLGLDCSGRDPLKSSGCSNGCIFDEDGDAYGFQCANGLDCNGIDPFMSTGCPNNCVSDNDGDGYGWGCDNGAECNDTDPYVNLDCSLTTDCKYDHDGDGYGLGCVLGGDCDDYHPARLGNCTADCTYDKDCNALPDEWQDRYFNNTVCNQTEVCGPNADPDGDGFSNIEEYRRDTDPITFNKVELPAEAPSTTLDTDNDGVSDTCERMYGLNPSDPFDAEKDNDNDGLTNKFECTFTAGSCKNWLNPTSPDTDNDGYTDKEEIDADTDPCDTDSKPSSLLPIILIIVGILANTGSIGYLIYKDYYIPLVSPPPKPAAVPKPGIAGRPVGAPSGVPQGPRRLPPRRAPVDIVSRRRFEDEMKKREAERDRILSVFGAKREIQKPQKVMEEIARHPELRRGRPVEQLKQPKPVVEDHISRLSRLVSGDYFDKISSFTKEEADYFGKLADITKRKELPLEEDQVSKLASITKKVVDDSEKKKELETAFKKAGMDELDNFLTTRKHVDTFIKEYSPGKKGSEFDALSKISEKGAVEALSDLSAPKRKDVMEALSDLSSKAEKEKAVSKMDELYSIESKDELFKAVKRMSKDKRVDRDVFEVLLSYLMKSGKISKHDVSELMFQLQEQGVLSKKDVSEVFFNLGIKEGAT